MKLVDVRKKLEAKVLPGTLCSGDNLADLSAPRLRSGVLVFDALFGGGVPMGKFNVFWGDKSSGKTTMALRVCGSFLKTFPNRSVVWCDMEHAYDDTWGRNFITDKKRFQYVLPDFGEEAVDLTCELAAAEDVGLIVFDSLGSIYAVQETEGEASDMFVSLQVRLINRMIRKLAPIVSQSTKTKLPKTVIFINQARAKFGGQSFGPQIAPTGGKFLAHVATSDTRFYLKEVKKIDGVPTLSCHSFSIEKNRVGLSRRSGEFAFYKRNYKGKMAGDVEESKTILSLGKMCGVIARDGSQWMVGKKKFATLNAITEALSDPKFEAETRELILAKLLESPIAISEEEGSE